MPAAFGCSKKNSIGAVSLSTTLRSVSAKRRRYSPPQRRSPSRNRPRPESLRRQQSSKRSLSAIDAVGANCELMGGFAFGLHRSHGQDSGADENDKKFYQTLNKLRGRVLASAAPDFKRVGGSYSNVSAVNFSPQRRGSPIPIWRPTTSCDQCGSES